MRNIADNAMMNRIEVTAIGKPAPWLIEAAASIGLDFAGLTHEVTNYFENHGLKRHGNAGTEKAQGQLFITPADIARIPDIVKKPDTAIIGIKRYGETLIAYSKRFPDGTILYYEEVLNSKRNKSLRSKTIYKKMGTVSKDTFLKIVANNAHTDVSGIKMVVGAGGNPGGEA
jgi:hypothetical protein